VWYWDLPTTPNGLKPLIAYSGAGSAPDGSIYIGGMDHRTNSALYSLPAAGGTATLPAPTLGYLGDARAASEAAGNYLPGEGIEKFHTRPTWYQGKVYVANLNHSDLDAGYLNKRGFHWYAYDTAGGSFTDLSAGAPHGVGALHGGIVSTVIDPARGVIYGYGGPYDPTIFNHVHYYDPAAGRFGERTGWKLRTQHAIDAAQCFTGPRVCYVADNLGTVWRFLDPDPATGKLEWRRVGSIGQSTTATYGANWVFHVNPGRTRAYLLTKRGKFFEMRLSDGRILRKLDFPAVEPAFAGWWYYGHNAWDQFGRFYLAAFKPLTKSTGVRLLAVDPARFLAATASGG